MAIFSKLSTRSARTVGRLSAIAAKTKAKVGPRLPRGATVLSGIKPPASVASKLGSSVPYMQGIADAVDQIVAYADGMKSNRKECKKVAALTEELVRGLLAETEGVEAGDLSARSKLNLAELEWRLETIGKGMEEMRKATLVRRLLANDEHAAKLVEHRRALQGAIAKFQLMQCIRVDLGMARIEKK